MIIIEDTTENADWTKGTWDLIGIDSVEKLRDFLASTDMSVQDFKQLPVYKRNVDKPDMEWLSDL
jgi:hypothetical protein